MKKRYLNLLSILILSILLITSCGGGGGSSDGDSTSNDDNAAPVFTNEIGWSMENIDPTYWTKNNPDDTDPPTMFLSVYIFVSDPDGMDDITNIILSDPEGSWTLKDIDQGIDNYDAEGGYYEGYRLYDSNNMHDLLIGDYVVTVTDSAGNTASQTRTFYEPGQNTSPDAAFLYSENYTGGLTNGSQMLKRAVIQSAGIDSNTDTIQLTFTTDDTNVNNGLIWFFDSSGDYVGYSDRFRDLIGSINTDNTNNSITISAQHIDFTDGKSINDIVGFHVILLDGAQYSDENWWDNRSISEYTLFD